MNEYELIGSMLVLIAALDTVDNRHLLQRLEVTGIRGTRLVYLIVRSDRFQFAHIYDFSSSYKVSNEFHY